MHAQRSSSEARGDVWAVPRGAMMQADARWRRPMNAIHSVNGLHVLHASRSRKKRTATTGLPIGTIGTRKNWGVNIDPHMDSFTAPLRPSSSFTAGSVFPELTHR